MPRIMPIYGSFIVIEFIHQFSIKIYIQILPQAEHPENSKYNASKYSNYLATHY